MHRLSVFFQLGGSTMMTGGVFTALLLLCEVVGGAVVLPPSNVSVSCENLKVTASWDDDHQQPHSRYRVTILGAPESHDIETNDLHCDVSRFIWLSEDHYTSSFHVAVRALQGGDQSKPVLSRTFSYNYLKLVDTQCALDFPPVDVYMGESGATVSFQNPIHFYRLLERARNSHFKYTVTSVKNRTTHEGDFEALCTADEELCKKDVELSEVKEACFKLKGTLFDSSGIQQVEFKNTALLCPPHSLKDHVVLIVVLMSILVLIIIVAAFLICKARAWTMKIPNPPKLLDRDVTGQTITYSIVSDEEFSAVSILAATKSPSVSFEDSSPSENLQASTAGSGYNSDGSFYAETNNLELASEGNGTDDDSADDSGQTENISVESEEEGTEFRSPYDCPHTLRLDMGNGDFATGYTGE